MYFKIIFDVWFDHAFFKCTTCAATAREELERHVEFSRSLEDVIDEMDKKLPPLPPATATTTPPQQPPRAEDLLAQL